MVHYHRSRKAAVNGSFLIQPGGGYSHDTDLNLSFKAILVLKHTGLFSRSRIYKLGKWFGDIRFVMRGSLDPVKELNLFAYTGGATWRRQLRSVLLLM